MDTSEAEVTTDSTQGERLLDFQLAVTDKRGEDLLEAAISGLVDLTSARLVVISSFEPRSGKAILLAASESVGATVYAIPEPAKSHAASGDRSVLVLSTLPSPDRRFPDIEFATYLAHVLRDRAGNAVGFIEAFFSTLDLNLRLATMALRLISAPLGYELYSRNVENRCQDLQERYEFALKAGGFGAYEWDNITHEVTVDKKYFEITGYGPTELKLDMAAWLSVLHPDDYEKVVVEMTRNEEGERDIYGPTRLRIKDKSGRYRWVEYQSYGRYADAERKWRRSIGVIRDVDEEIRAAESLREATARQEQLHQQIKEREERYSFALKVGRLGVYDWYPREGRTILSPVLAELMGIDDEESSATYQDWISRVHPDDHHLVNVNALMSPSKAKSEFPSVYRFKNAEGDYRWVESHHMAMMTDDQGRISRIVGIVKDIDEAKRSADLLSQSLEQQKLLNLELSKREQALTEVQRKLMSQMKILRDLNRDLRESEARWAYALEGNGDGVIEWDMATDKLFYSARAKAILGFDFEEDREKLISRIHPDNREEFLLSFRRSVLPPFEPFQMEVQIRDDRRGYHWLMFRGKVVESKQGRPLKMVGTVTDLSQVKLFQKEFTIYEQLIKQSQSVILFVGLDGTIAFINATALSSLGYTRDEIVGQNIATLIGEVDVKRILSEDFADELTLFTKSGYRIIAEVASALIRHDGIEIGYVFNAIDITEKRELEERIHALSLARFEAELKGQRKKTEMVIEVQENEKERIAKELHDGIGQLLTLAKLNIEEMEPTLAPTQVNGFRNLKDIVNNISTDIKGLTRELMPLSLRNLTFECALVDLLERCRELLGKMDFRTRINLSGYDPDPKVAIHVYRTIQEAINNAIKYSEATKMTFMCLKLKQSLNIVIEDNGRGFNLEAELVKANAFGLKTMKERAVLIGGDLQIDSQINAGTTISLTIPL